MSDIKFKAWDKIHKKMSNTFTLLDCISQKQVFVNPENFEFIRYIGLEDKNGVEIYEGDIIFVEWMDNETIDKGEVIWCDAGFRFSMQSEGFDHDPAHWHKEHADLWDDPSTLNIEVIGNIYENKELLK